MDKLEIACATQETAKLSRGYCHPYLSLLVLYAQEVENLLVDGNKLTFSCTICKIASGESSDNYQEYYKFEHDKNWMVTIIIPAEYIFLKEKIILIKDFIGSC